MGEEPLLPDEFEVRFVLIREDGSLCIQYSYMTEDSRVYRQSDVKPPKREKY